MKRICDKWLVAVRVLCAIALLSVGFAHKVPVVFPEQIAAAELAAYVLPDGTLPDICLTMEHGSDRDHAYSGDCEACRLSATILLPAPADMVGERIALAEEPLFVPRAAVIPRLILAPNASPRAPPAEMTV